MTLNLVTVFLFFIWGYCSEQKDYVLVTFWRGFLKRNKTKSDQQKYMHMLMHTAFTINTASNCPRDKVLPGCVSDTYSSSFINSHWLKGFWKILKHHEHCGANENTMKLFFCRRWLPNVTLTFAVATHTHTSCFYPVSSWSLIVLGNMRAHVIRRGPAQKRGSIIIFQKEKIK